MNVLGMVLSLILILSYGFFASWEKHRGVLRLRNTYVGHHRAYRKLLNRYESQLYKAFRKEKRSTLSDLAPLSGKPASQKKKGSVACPVNPSCARLNIRVLMEPQSSSEQVVYEAAASLLRSLYQRALFPEGKRFEYRFLDGWIAAGKRALAKHPQAPLEKWDLQNLELQRVYYRMLKGTKPNAWGQEGGYPPLSDIFKIDGKEEAICLCHAHPIFLKALFGSKAGQRLYEQMQSNESFSLTQEQITALCHESGRRIDPGIFLLLNLKRHSHGSEEKRTFIAEDAFTKVCLRKEFYFPKMRM